MAQARKNSPGRRRARPNSARPSLCISTSSESERLLSDVDSEEDSGLASPLRVELDFSEGHDKYSQFFYRPHFLLALSVGTSGLYWAAFYTSGDSFPGNVKRGLLGVCAAFLLYCSLPTPVPNAVFRRPHPILWRLVTGATIIYFLFLIFLLFQTVQDGRVLVTHIDPCRNGIVRCADKTMIGSGLGVIRPLPERDYAANCEVFTGGPACKWWANLENGEEACFLHLQLAIEDEYVVAHLLGWLGKSLIFRHAGVAWLNSIVFEFVEMSFEHWMPNFAECWWDHWVMDVLTCNLGGIIIGHMIMRYYSMKQYRWMNVSAIPKFRGKVVYVCVLVVDFNAFALKYVLYIPPSNPLNIYRLVLWWFVGMIATRELYEYSTNKAVKRLGHHAWLAWMVMFTEGLVCCKFGRAAGEFQQPFPTRVKMGWGLFFAGYALWLFQHFVIVPRHITLQSAALDFRRRFASPNRKQR